MAGKKEIKLVPTEEQPYEIPENWCWTTIGTLADVKGGKRLPKGKVLIDSKTEHPYIRVTDFKEQSVNSQKVKYIDEDTFSEIKNYIISSRDIYVSIAGSIGKVGIIPDELDGANLTENAAKITNIRCVNQKYLLHALMTEMAQEQMSNATVSTTQAKLALCRIETVCIPLAPVAEQERIVTAITELFADLDKAAENAEKIIKKHKAKKESILYCAFSGELTAQWRKKNGFNNDEWQERTLDEISHSIYDGDHMPPPKAENGVPFLMISNVNTGYLSFDNTKYVAQDYYDSLSETRKPRKGDVLYTLVGSYGIPVVVDTDTPFCFQRHMAVIKPRDIDTRFLWYQMQSQDIFNKATSIATGTAQLTVPIKGLRQMSVKVPTLAEQQEIVRILDELLGNEQRIKEAAEEMLDKIAMMKKSILADAFRGKLGTNDPADEPATELLRQILA